MNIETALNKACIILKQNGIQSANLDSEILMSKILEKDKKFILLNLKKELDKKNLIDFNKLINQRIKGKPIAYLVGVKSFWKYEFKVNENVLIPRPDTELLVEQVLKIFKNKKYINLLDVGVGSGCIILSILKEKKYFKGTGIDLCPESLKICKINANKLGVSQRISLFNSDVDNSKYGKYDIIISNPPYINNLDLRKLNKDVKDFEPKLALNGGFEGLSEIKKVVNRSSKLIKKKGKLILEIAFDQKDKVKKLLKENNFYIDDIFQDLAKKDRCIVSTKI